MTCLHPRLPHRNEQLNHAQPKRHRNDLNRIKRWVGLAGLNPAQVCAKKTATLGEGFLRVPERQSALAYAGTEPDGEGDGFHTLEFAACALIHTHTNSYIWSP